MTISPIHVPNIGPLSAEILIIGEAPGQNEEIYRQPFVGGSGTELKLMLTEAGLDFDSCYCTNVFPFRPKDNNVLHYFTDKKTGITTIPPLKPGKYLHPDHLIHLETLKAIAATPNFRVLIPLGNTALWALTGLQGITKYRGVWRELRPAQFILPTFHPSAILRRYQDRPIVVSDFLKVKDYLNGPAPSPISNESYSLLLNPTPGDIKLFKKACLAAEHLTVDIETKAGFIRTIGFGTDAKSAVVFPFWDSDTGNYWESAEDELAAMDAVAVILSSPIPKIFQNGLYDLQYIWRVWGMRVTNVVADTMLLHHSLQPEMPKSLGFLGSVYTNNPAWKEMRKTVDSSDAEKDGE